MEYTQQILDYIITTELQLILSLIAHLIISQFRIIPAVIILVETTQVATTQVETTLEETTLVEITLEEIILVETTPVEITLVATTQVETILLTLVAIIPITPISTLGQMHIHIM